MDLQAEKRALRREMIQRVLALGTEDRERQQAALEERFSDLPGLEGAETVLLYVTAFPEEVVTAPLIDRTLSRGQRLALPRVECRSQSLRLFEVRDPAAELSRGSLGIPEPGADCPEITPQQVDWVLVPGLAFDPRGFRLGRGAGHYDRLLPQLRPDAPRWALAFDSQWLDMLPVEPHDQPLDGIVSPGRSAVGLRRTF